MKPDWTKDLENNEKKGKIPTYKTKKEKDYGGNK